jgi:hypothetical protein
MKCRKSGNAGGVGRIALLFVCSLLFCAQVRVIGQVLHDLTTTYEGGWLQDGIMFDVTTDTVPLDLVYAVDMRTSTPDGISVNGINFLTPVLEETVCVELFTKAGTFEDGAFDSTKWTFLGSFSVMGQGPDAPTSIPPGSFDPIKIGLGQTQAFYITTQDENLRYTALDPAESMTGDVYVSSNSHYLGPSTATGRSSNRLLQSSDGLTVEILTGVSKQYPFAESWPHRVFNGALLYTLGMESSTKYLSNLSEEQIEEALSIKRGSVTCDKPAVLNILPTSSPSTLQSSIQKLATTLHGGLKQSGMMFDILVPSVADGGPPEGLTIIALQTSTFLTNEVCVEVYSKNGTYIGYEQDIVLNADGSWSSDTWKVLGAATVVGEGETTPTRLPIGSIDPVFVAAGERHAFYVTLTQPEMRYTQPQFGEKSGDVFATSPDGYISILIGSAVAYPFEEIWADRIYNGAVVYTLGDVGDTDKYNEINSKDRKRTCPAVVTDLTPSTPINITDSTPSKPINSVVVVEKPTEPTAVGDPTLSEQAEEEVTTSQETGSSYTGRLADVCTDSGEVTATKDVVIKYDYAFIIDKGADISAMVKEMENAVHTSLVSNKCPIAGIGWTRLLQASSTPSYKGFNSEPADQVTGEKCGEASTEECHIVSGGVTAVVGADVDVTAIMVDMDSYLESIISDPAIYQPLGIQQVLYKPPMNTETLTVKATDANSNTKEPKPFSTMSIIIISACGCVLVVALLALLAKRARRHRRINHTGANSLELFQEFPEEADRVAFSRYGIHANSEQYDQNLAPKTTKGKTRPPPGPSAPSVLKRSSYRPSAVILNDADDISLFSGEQSGKYRFSGPILVGQRVRTGSTGSVGSRSSTSSKKSVEFVKAGQSFNSSSQPEDTVDL